MGAEADDSRIELLLSEVKGKDITELIASGREKLASVPSGGGGIAVSAAPSAGGGGGSAPAAEAKKEEKVEEKEESDDVSFLNLQISPIFSTLQKSLHNIFSNPSTVCLHRTWDSVSLTRWEFFY